MRCVAEAGRFPADLLAGNPMDATRVFRKVALERMSSPEQLDQLLRVTTPKTWLALLSLIALLAVAVAWGYWGQLTTRVSGQGVLIRSGGVQNVVALGAGQVVAIRVRVGRSHCGGSSDRDRGTAVDSREDPGGREPTGRGDQAEGRGAQGEVRPKSPAAGVPETGARQRRTGDRRPVGAGQGRPGTDPGG